MKLRNAKPSLPRWFMAAVLVMSAVMWCPRARALTLKEILLLHRTGVSADIIIENIRRSGRRPRLSPADVERLRKAKVSPVLISEVHVIAFGA